MQRRSKRLLLLSDFESQQFRGIGNYEQKKSWEITQVTTTPADPEQSLDQWCFNAGHCPRVFYFPVVLCSLGTSCCRGLKLQRNRRALSQIRAQEQPVLSVGFGGCRTGSGPTKIHLWKCPWRSVWVEEERNGDLQFIISKSPKMKSNSSSFCSWCKASPTRAHQPLQELDLPGPCTWGRKNIPNLPLEFSSCTWSCLSFASRRRKPWSFGSLYFAYIFGISVSKPGNSAKNLFFTSGISCCSRGTW